jgi:hypothetical protein
LVLAVVRVVEVEGGVKAVRASFGVMGPGGV